MENLNEKTSRKKNRNKTKPGNVILLIVVIAVSMFLGWLVANVSDETYNVAFDIGNGASTNLRIDANGKVLKPADPVKEGYTFDGWFVNGEKFDFNTKITKDTTLTAKWIKVEKDKEDKEDKEENKPVIYTVTFNSNSGSSVASQTVEEGKLATVPANPKRSGYTFNGWYNGNVKYDFKSQVTSNLTLTAKWTKVEENKTDNKTDNKTETVTKYTVKFDSNGGSKVSNKTVEKGKTVAKPSNPTRSGYTFKGWYLNGKAFNFSTKITGNITLKASWEKKDVITYKIEDIPNSVANQQKLYVLKNGVKVAGTVDIVNTSGKTVTRSVPATGTTIVKGTYTKITNVKVN